MSRDKDVVQNIMSEPDHGPHSSTNYKCFVPRVNRCGTSYPTKISIQELNKL